MNMVRCEHYALRLVKFPSFALSMKFHRKSGLAAGRPQGIVPTIRTASLPRQFRDDHSGVFQYVSAYLLINQSEQACNTNNASRARQKAGTIPHLSIVAAMTRKKTAKVNEPMTTPRSSRQAAALPWKWWVKAPKMLANTGKGVSKPLN